MSSVLLACNKLSSSNITKVFKEIEAHYRTDAAGAAEALVAAFTEENIQTNLLAVSSILKLVHGVLDQTVVPRVLEQTAHVPLYCYLYNYGVLDSSFIDSALERLLAGGDYLSVLQILQMCSALLSPETLQLIKTGVVVDPASFLSVFLVESAELVLQRRNPYRDTLKEELGTIQAAVEGIVKQSTGRLVSALSIAEDPEEAEAAALKFGMNTALRKRIFRILTTSRDYVEAQRLLYKESLKVKQFEEVFYLLMYFCMQESRYNRYYADLAVSLIRTASASHRSLFNKYVYSAIERQLPQLEKLAVKEIYNLGMYIAEVYLEGLITIRCISRLEFLSKKEQTLGKVLFKQVTARFQGSPSLKVKKMRETDTLKRFFLTGLVDNVFLKKEHKPALSSVYRLIHKPNK